MAFFMSSMHYGEQENILYKFDIGVGSNAELDCTSSGIRNCVRGNKQPTASVIILLPGDYPQNLPSIPRSIPADELNVNLRSSNL